jgi:histidinol-phosphate/aromatic aminotransferase/cobyric acid decarboxylase-like protein
MFDPDHFFPPALLGVPRPTKRDYGGRLNLSNNELQHSRIDAVISDFYATAEISWVSRYMYWPSLLSLLAKHFRLPPECVWISAGSDQAIRALVWLAAAAGCRLILQSPNYATYTTAAATEGIEVEVVSSVWSSPQEELGGLCAAARRPGRALVVITNPHAFTGRLLPPDGVAHLAAVCEEEGHLLAVDEAYVWFAKVDHLSLLERFSNLLLVRSFSKGFGMAGLRFAALFARPRVVEYLSRTRCMAEVSGVSAAFVEHCLARWPVFVEVWREVAQRRDYAARIIEGLEVGWSCPSSSTNFQLVETGERRRAEWVTTELERCSIAVRSLAAEPTLASCFRFTVAGDEATQRLLDALVRIGT